MSALEELGNQRLDEIILDQQQTIRELRAEVKKLKQANEHLREKLSRKTSLASEREGKRQAAPFRRTGEKRAEQPSDRGARRSTRAPPARYRSRLIGA